MPGIGPDCKGEPPLPASPSGQLGLRPAVTSTADPFTTAGVSIASVYGTNYQWWAYDNGCGAGSDIMPRLTTNIANVIGLQLPGLLLAIGQGLFTAVIDPSGWIGFLDKPIEHATASVAAGVWFPFLSLALLLVAVVTLLRAARGRLAGDDHRHRVGPHGPGPGHLGGRVPGREREDCSTRASKPLSWPPRRASARTRNRSARKPPPGPAQTLRGRLGRPRWRRWMPRGTPSTAPPCTAPGWPACSATRTHPPPPSSARACSRRRTSAGRSTTPTSGTRPGRASRSWTAKLATSVGWRSSWRRRTRSPTSSSPGTGPGTGSAPRCCPCSSPWSRRRSSSSRGC